MVGVNLRELPVSVRRIVATVVALVCHISLLVALLRPGSDLMDTALAFEDKPALIELRFIPVPSTASAASQASQSASRREASADDPRPTHTRRIRPDVAQRQSSLLDAPTLATVPAAPVAITASPKFVATEPPATAPTSFGDGGFRERLRNAQRPQNVTGVPGSDAPAAPGLQLTDPMNQGIGAVMRSTQRLFGIADRHCIDVEVWDSLSPDELSARHLSPADVRSEGEKYHCNRPLGLSF